jgi:HAD superfamily hydrolase (TIGR01490 family)
MESNKTLALWDFDGTFYKGDSFIDFLKFIEPGRFWPKMLMVSPAIIAWKLKLITNSRAKEIVMAYFIKNWPISKLQSAIDAFYIEHKNKLIEPAVEKMNWHRDKGHHIVFVTATFSQLVKPFASPYNAKLIATNLKIENQTVLGKFDGLNCYGAEKVNRIQKELNLSLYTYIYAYGDTRGDIPMLSLAHFPCYRKY